MAAVAMSKRLCYERDVKLGDEVFYLIPQLIF